MFFTFVCAATLLSAFAVIAKPLLRRDPSPKPVPTGASKDVAFYKSQLAELDRDVARGTMSAEEAERARTEIARRLLAADKAQAPVQNAAPQRVSRIAAALIFAVMAGGAGALYMVEGAPGYGDLPLKARLAASEEVRANRPSQSRMAARIPESPPLNVPEEYAAMIDQLRAAASTRPDDLEAHRLLAQHEAQLGDYAAALAAQRNVIRILGEDAKMDEFVTFLDLMVMETRGYVSPEAEDLARDMLKRDPENDAALYYLGSLYDRTDRPDVAVRLWRGIIERNNQTAHAQMARALIEQAAVRAGMRYALPQVPSAPIPGPSAEDLAAASAMDPAAREEMIRGMVAQLNQRLATEGGTAEEWARLIGALAVLEERDQAQAIWDEAQGRFASQPDDLEIIRAAAARAELE